MNTYIISFTVEKGSTHTHGQSETSKIINDTGVDWRNKRWVMGQGSEEQHWRVKCDEEQLTLLVLKGGKVVKNITELARASGLAKLTDDEKEALGIICTQ